MDDIPITPADPEPKGVALTETQRYMIIACGGLAVVAIGLALLSGRRKGAVPSDWTAEVYPVSGADWQASLRRFVEAADIRFQGIQQQLDAIHQQVGTTGPAATVSPTVSAFPPGPSGNGSANQTYESATANQEENVPPSPAATSLP